MRYIYRKGIMAALVIGLILGVVGFSWANFVIRQNSDGTTDWVDVTPPSGPVTARVGRWYYTFRITDAGTPATYYYSSPISGVLFGAFAVQSSSPVSYITTSLTFWLMEPLSPGRFTSAGASVGGSISLPPTTGQLGTVRYNRPVSWAYVSNGPDVTQMVGNVNVQRGGIIALSSGGEGGAGGGNSGIDAAAFDVIIIIDAR